MRRISDILPRRLATTRRVERTGRLSEALLRIGLAHAARVLAELDTSMAGLSTEEAERRLHEHGPNVVQEEERPGRFAILGRALLNPLVVLLVVLATVSGLTGDLRAAVVMGLMVVLGVSLRFVQEARADSDATKLRAMITVTATVTRDATTREVPRANLVPGDLVDLSAGDMVPADVRLVSAKDLFVIQASLTGESMPVEKFDAPEAAAPASALDLRNVCFLGPAWRAAAAGRSSSLPAAPPISDPSPARWPPRSRRPRSTGAYRGSRG